MLLGAAPDPVALDAMVVRRVAGEPLEQVVGFADFAGVRVAVAPGVFVPRRRSEHLVAVAAGLALRPGAVVVDVGCGTGALGVALVARLARLDVPVSLHACDLDPAAVTCAARNVPPGAQVHQGDLLDALPDRLRGQVDLLLANAPYVPSGEIALLPAEARDHEHHLALDGGPDGLDVHRRLAAAAPAWLRPGGTLLIEVNQRQRAAAGALLAAAGLDVREHPDPDPDVATLTLAGTSPLSVGSGSILGMTASTPVTARLRQVVLDTTDVRGLAEFYRRFLGWDYRAGDEPPAELDWVVLRNPDGGVSMAFQLADALPESTWPDPAVPQQLHIDLSVPDADSLRAEHERVQGLGARLVLDRFDDPDEPLYVYADPAGHPFCIFVSPA